jgi:hypothetical protein
VKLVAALFLIMLAIGGATFLVFRAAPGGGCQDLLIEEVTSPNGRNVAARFAHRCGRAPTATQVALRPAGTPFAPDERSTVFATRDPAPVQLRWRDGQTLVVESSSDSLIAPRTEWRNVAIVLRRIH